MSSVAFEPTRVVECRISLAIPRFTWRWLFPGYRDGYRDGVAAGKAHERNVLRTPIIMPDHDASADLDTARFVDEMGWLPGYPKESVDK